MTNPQQHQDRTVNDGELVSRRISRRNLVKTITVAGGAVVFAGYGRSTWVTAQDKVKLTQWYHEYGEEGTQEAVQRYAQEYTTANPNVEVEVVWVPGDYLGAKLPAALLTDEGPDVFEGALTIPNLAMVRAGQIVPLDDLYTEEVKADFHPNNLALNTIEGKLYGVQMINDFAMLYYRKSMLEEAGVQPPTTMDEVIAAAKALDTGRVKGLYLGSDGGIFAMRTVAPWAAGSDFLVDNEIVFDNENTALAYEKVRELNETGALLIGAPTDWPDPSSLTEGLAAMQWTGLWAMPGIQKALGDDFGVLPWPPVGESGRPATFWSGWTQMVNAKSKHIEEAKAFVKWLWLERTDLQQDWALGYGFHIPPRLSAAAAAEPLKSGPAADAAKIFSDYGRILPPTWTSAMDTALVDALSNVVKNGAPAAEQVHAAAETCRAELERLLAG